MRAKLTYHETRTLQTAAATPGEVYFSFVPTSAKRKRSQIKLLSTWICGADIKLVLHLILYQCCDHWIVLMSIPSCTISHNGLQHKKIHWRRVITQTARLFIAATNTVTSLTSLMTFAVMFCYLRRSERNACKIQACMGLKPRPLRCRCRAPPAELSGQLGASHHVGLLWARYICAYIDYLFMRIYPLS